MTQKFVPKNYWGNKFCFTLCIQVAFELVMNDNLGLMIRGGIEYGLGIYITGVDEESAAFRNGLRVRFPRYLHHQRFK